MKWLFYWLIYDILTGYSPLKPRIKGLKTVYCATINTLAKTGVFSRYIATKTEKNVTKRKNNLYKNR
ncbi:hypothetical protein LPB144_00425 [Christiangramia salexigens]|uniref:Uncharacterized protein n=1 Tax=Christiangramia salexigens TaxID=1913577 RepID=A0A1L3J1G6_9FLAO|nr:hypothetical protein LPB144_00425 [Christiangramia salexigens]